VEREYIKLLELEELLELELNFQEELLELLELELNFQEELLELLELELSFQELLEELLCSPQGVNDTVATPPVRQPVISGTG
jgi:hypothetical protein